MIVERSMHPGWLSNAFLLADEPGGTAVFVDSGAPLESLLEAVERERVTPTHLLVTHGHADHVAGNDELVERFGLEVVTGPVETGGLIEIRGDVLHRGQKQDHQETPPGPIGNKGNGGENGLPVTEVGAIQPADAPTFVRYAG